MRKLLVAVFIGTSLLIARGTSSDETFGLDNGRVWRSLEPTCRGTYLAGMVQGWKLRENTEESFRGKVIGAFSVTGQFEFGELAGMVTSIYADDENIGLPIGWVVLASFAIQRGETDRSTVLTHLRGKMTDLLSGPHSRPGTDFDPIDAIQAARTK